MANMALTVSVPKDYGYVLITAAGTCFIGLYHALVTGKARKPAKTPYPNAYCSREEINSDKDKYLFNCAQRAHANYLEHQPLFLFGLLASGIRYPLAAAAMGVWWGVFRLVYLRGYIRRDKTDGKGRNAGTAYLLAEFGLLGLTAWTGWEMLTL